MNLGKLSASFRDPSGFVFRFNGEIYRQVNLTYAEEYDFLMSSGLYDNLTKNGSLVPHQEIEPRELPSAVDSDRYKIIKPTLVPYVSYPYEWCFSQLKDAALLTLSIQETALEHGAVLKDATAYNVQFVGSKPIFIDTLSFERYRAGEPWIAYRQFCQHFLGPLALMARSDVRLRHLLRSYLDGLPLDLVSGLLPRRTLANYSFLAHIHLHSSSQKRHQDDARDSSSVKKTVNMSKTMQLALVASLRKAVMKCQLGEMKTEWGDYYEDTNYSSDSMSGKERLIDSLVKTHVGDNETIHDVGGNTGKFSRLVASSGRYVLSHDIDELAVERNYLYNKKNGIKNVLPLVLDLGNPTPGLGWTLAERDSLIQRINSDVIMALALIHHIVISNNVPMAALAKFFYILASKLIIEFVPKEDSQVKRLLATREDIFPRYDIEQFEIEFGRYFTIVDKRSIQDTERTLFVMERS
jgi:ribosomal protein L11 methylase PrmA